MALRSISGSRIACALLLVGILGANAGRAGGPPLAAPLPATTTLLGSFPDGDLYVLTLFEGRRPARLVVLVPDGPGDPQRNAPFLDALLSEDTAVLELGIGGDTVAPLGDALAEVALTVGLGNVELALLGVGTGARIALAEAGRHRVAALYPGCAGLPVPPGPALLIYGGRLMDVSACPDLARRAPDLRVVNVPWRSAVAGAAIAAAYLNGPAPWPGTAGGRVLDGDAPPGDSHASFRAPADLR